MSDMAVEKRVKSVHLYLTGAAPLAYPAYGAYRSALTDSDGIIFSCDKKDNGHIEITLVAKPVGMEAH